MATPRPTCPNKALSLQYETAHRGFWDCMVPAEHTLEDVLGPYYFGKVCAELEKGGGKQKGQLYVSDRIAVESEHGEWFVEVQVVAFNRALQRCEVRAIAAPVHFNVEVSKGYEIKYHGTVRKWCIERGEDQIAGGFASKIEAQVKLEEMLTDGRRAA